MALTNKTKTSITDALAKNLPAEIPNKKNVSAKPNDEILTKDSEDDFEYSRNNLKHLISTSSEAIEIMLALAQDAEHPRAFEVLAGMLRDNADMNLKLISSHKERKKLLNDIQPKNNDGGGNTTNNTIYVGTTNDLQKLLNERDAKNKTIDV